MDWADEIALKLRRNSGTVSVATALRKAKADGVRLAAEYYANNHSYESTLAAPLGGPFVKMLYEAASNLESPHTTNRKRHGAPREFER